MTNSPTDHGHITSLANDVKQEYENPLLETTEDSWLGRECERIALLLQKISLKQWRIRKKVVYLQRYINFEVEDYGSEA